MDHNQTNKFFEPARLHPLSSVQAKIRQAASLALAVGGLILLVLGGWLFYQSQFQASLPPHIPVVGAAAVEPTQPSIAPLRLTPIKPTATSLPSSETPLVTPTPMPTPQNLSSNIATKITPAPTITPTPTFTPTLEPRPPTQETVAAPLVDNSLPVVEAETPIQATATPGGDSPAVSPPTRIVAKSISLDAKVN
ncbi:MAG: hypothetical protein DPW09_01385 [Anaerolineae bacterium]|nr:hypothetical protein [Anaerolineae bacterium]